MSEIELVKRIKYAGDVHAALMELGWDAKTAAAFLDSIPDADREEVFKHLHWVKEALEMAKQTVVPVVHCRDCEHCLINLKWNTALCMRTVFRQNVPLDGFCNFGERIKGR